MTDEVKHVTRGFKKARTSTSKNPYPWLQVQVYVGAGAGCPGKPQGCP